MCNLHFFLFFRRGRIFNSGPFWYIFWERGGGGYCTCTQWMAGEGAKMYRRERKRNKTLFFVRVSFSCLQTLFSLLSTAFSFSSPSAFSRRGINRKLWICQICAIKTQDTDLDEWPAVDFFEEGLENFSLQKRFQAWEETQISSVSYRQSKTIIFPSKP